MSSIAGLKNFHIQSIEEEAHRFTLKSPDGKETQFTLKMVDEKTGKLFVLCGEWGLFFHLPL